MRLAHLSKYLQLNSLAGLRHTRNACKRTVWFSIYLTTCCLSFVQMFSLQPSSVLPNGMLFMPSNRASSNQTCRPFLPQQRRIRSFQCHCTFSIPLKNLHRCRSQVSLRIIAQLRAMSLPLSFWSRAVRETQARMTGASQSLGLAVARELLSVQAEKTIKNIMSQQQVDVRPAAIAKARAALVTELAQLIETCISVAAPDTYKFIFQKIFAFCNTPVSMPIRAVCEGLKLFYRTRCTRSSCPSLLSLQKPSRSSRDRRTRTLSLLSLGSLSDDISPKSSHTGSSPSPSRLGLTNFNLLVPVQPARPSLHSSGHPVHSRRSSGVVLGH